MTRLACSLFLTFLPFLTFAGENPSALKALKVLPKADVKKLARIEAQGGTPVPDRWHFLVHDPKSSTGIKEYVVASGELVAEREVSQFAETLTETDVIGSTALKIDSDKVVELAQKYAAANQAPVTTINYQLIREGEKAQPIWRVKCLDEEGSVSGTLVITASKGSVVSHEGFAVEPPKSKSGKKNKSALRLETESPELVAVAAEQEGDPEEGEEAPEFLEEDEDGQPAVAKSGQASTRKRVVSESGRSPSKREVRRHRSKVTRPASVARRVTRPVRQIVRRILPF